MRLLDVEWDGSLYPYSPKRLGLRVAIWAPPDCRHQMGLGAVAGALRSHACRQAMSPKRPCQPRFGSDSSHAERALERIEPEWRHDTTAPSGRVYYRIAPTFDWAGRSTAAGPTSTLVPARLSYVLTSSFRRGHRSIARASQPESAIRCRLPCLCNRYVIQKGFTATMTTANRRNEILIHDADSPPPRPGVARGWGVAA